MNTTQLFFTQLVVTMCSPCPMCHSLNLAPPLCWSGSKSLISFNSVLLTTSEAGTVIAILQRRKLRLLCLCFWASQASHWWHWDPTRGSHLDSLVLGYPERPVSRSRWPCALRWPWAWSICPTTALCTRTWPLATAWSARRDRWRCRPSGSARMYTTGRRAQVGWGEGQRADVL